MGTEIIIIGIIALAVGAVGGIFIPRLIVKNKADRLIQEAKVEAERSKQEKILEGEKKYLQFKSQYENEVADKNKNFETREREIRQKEQTINRKVEEVEHKDAEVKSIRDNLNRQIGLVNTKKEDLEKFHQQYVEKIEKVANISAKDAKEEMIKSLKEEAKTDALAHIKEIVDEAKLKANKEAKKIIIQTIQRVGAEQTIENTISVFHLDSDDLKGQIIGREGRNIRTLEAAAGVSLVVDDTPEAIVISSFDPLRRETARLSLQRLVADGRIHPARIEEVVEKTKKQLEEQVLEIGERTVIELGIHGLHADLIKIVGRMRFRSSYGQNLLHHSKETARICAIMSAELGLNTKLAKRAGLLHDIGKVPEEETDLSHALLGMKLAEKYGEHAAVCNAIGAHHDEIEMEYVISPVVQVCDAISGARPGARREVTDSYIQRLKDMENLAMNFEGVEKAYALQAGRELRVIVESDKVSDKTADTLSFQISDKIAAEMQYPGQIKVTVIREKRAISFAK